MNEKIAPQKFPILFLGSQIAVGGAQHLLLSKSRWFHERGYPVIAAFFYDKEGLYDLWRRESPFPLINLQGWNKKRSPINVFRLLRALFRLYWLIRENRFTVVETFTHQSNLLGLPLAWAAGVPVRFASHHGRVANFPPWLIGVHSGIVNLGIATGMIAVSTRMCELAVKEEGIKPDRITVIPNGIDISTEVLLDEQERLSYRQSLGVSPGDFLILSVGRLVHPKGHRYLLEAMPGVLKRFPHTVLVIAGDGPLRESLEAEAQTLQIEQSVRFAGSRKDVPRLLRLADCFVMASLSEGLPVALLEAMWAGLPVIATNAEGIGEVIVDGENGLLVPTADSSALGQAIQRIMSDEALRERLGREGKAQVANKFSIDHMCKQYESLFLQKSEVNA